MPRVALEFKAGWDGVWEEEWHQEPAVGTQRWVKEWLFRIEEVAPGDPVRVRLGRDDAEIEREKRILRGLVTMGYEVFAVEVNPGQWEARAQRGAQVIRRSGKTWEKAIDGVVVAAEIGEPGGERAE